LAGLLTALTFSGILWLGAVCFQQPQPCLGILYIMFDDPFTGEEFNQKKWQSYRPSDALDAGRISHPRQKMARNFETILRRKRMTMGEVKKLLGKSEYDKKHPKGGFV